MRIQTKKKVNRFWTQGKNPTGFTLMELLLVTGLLAVLSLTVYSAFSNGLNLWRVMNQKTPQEDVNIFFSKISYDIRNSFKYSGIEFSGREDSIALAVPVKSEKKRDGEIGRVNYVFDKETNSLNRFQQNYSQLYSGQSGTRQKCLDSIRFLNYQYYFYDSETEKYFWLKAWDEREVPLGVKIAGHLPLAVKIEVELNGRDEKFVKIVTFTVGG